MPLMDGIWNPPLLGNVNSHELKEPGHCPEAVKSPWTSSCVFSASFLHVTSGDGFGSLVYGVDSTATRKRQRGRVDLHQSQRTARLAYSTESTACVLYGSGDYDYFNYLIRILVSGAYKCTQYPSVGTSLMKKIAVVVSTAHVQH